MKCFGIEHFWGQFSDILLHSVIYAYNSDGYSKLLIKPTAPYISSSSIGESMSSYTNVGLVKVGSSGYITDMDPIFNGACMIPSTSQANSRIGWGSSSYCNYFYRRWGEYSRVYVTQIPFSWTNTYEEDYDHDN